MNRSVVSVVLAFTLLSAHFGLCLWSSLAQTTSPPAYVSRYTQPLFLQPWSTLGTDYPTSYSELEYRALIDKKWSDWQDATTSFGYDTSTPVERLEQGINEQLRWQITHNLYTENGRAQFDRVLESSAYSKALYYVLRMENHHKQINPDSVQLRLSICFTPEPTQAYTRQCSYLNFPIYGTP